MKLRLRGGPAHEVGSAVHYDGSSASAAAIIEFCGPNHAELKDGVLTVFVETSQPGEHSTTINVVVESGGYVVNPHRGGFVVLKRGGIIDWETV